MCYKRKKMKNIRTIIFIVLSIGLLATTTNNKEILIEEELVFENWMAEPFIVEEVFVEEPLQIEDWMTKPLIVSENL